MAEHQRACRFDTRAADIRRVQKPRAVRAELGDEAVADRPTAAVDRAVEARVIGAARRRETVGGETADEQVASSIHRGALNLVLSRGSQIRRVDSAPSRSSLAT